jgi:drug/metabolite transporter (DMT)-like permease
MTAAQQQQHRTRLIVAFTALYVLWGSTFMAISVAVRHMPPTMMGATRFLLSGVLMLLWCAVTGRKIGINFRDFWMLGLIGVLLLTGGNVVVGWAEQYVPSGLAALILAVTPIWVAIIEAWILKSDRLSRRGVVGLVFGTLGLLVLLWPKITSGAALERQQLWAAIALIFAALSWTTGSIVSKRSKVSVDIFVATGWQMLLAGCVNLSLAGALGDIGKVEWTGESVAAIAYLVVGGSLLGFTAYIWLLEHVATAKVATYAYVNPMVAVFLGWLILHERVDAYILAGSAVIVAGVILVTTSKIKKGSVPLEKNEADLQACEVAGD